MNIAILVPSLGIGGAERVAAFLGNYYYEKGYHVFYFLLANCGKSFFPAKGTIVKTHVFSPFLRGERNDIVRELAFAARSYRKLKKRYRIDVAISFMETCNYINICSKGREKVVISVRTVLSERNECKGILLNKNWIKTLYNRADQVVAVSEYVKNDLSKKYAIRDKKLVAIPNISVLYESIHEDLPWEYGVKTIVSVGRLDPIKQHERMIRAFSYVSKRQPEARLLLVGGGNQLNYLKDICKKMQIEDNVIFIGESTDVGYYLHHARAFVMSSRVDGFPNAMVEAMACGVPVITTDSRGGCGEIVGKVKSADGIQYCKYGILTPHMEGKPPEQILLTREEKMLGEGMLQLLEDEELHKKYSDRARRRAEDYSEEKIMARWDQIVKSQCEGEDL